MLTPSELAVLVQLLGNTLKFLEGLEKDLLGALEHAASSTFTRAMVAETLAALLETRTINPGMRVVALFLLYALYRQGEAAANSNATSSSPVSPDHPFNSLLYSLISTEDTPVEEMDIETYFMARYCANPYDTQKQTVKQILAQFSEFKSKKLKLPMTLSALRALHVEKEIPDLPSLMSLGISRRILLDDSTVSSLPQADELGGQLFTPPYVTLAPPMFPIRPDEMAWVQPLIHVHAPLWDYSLSHPTIHNTFLPTSNTTNSPNPSTSSNNTNPPLNSSNNAVSTVSTPPASPMKEGNAASPSVSSKFPVLEREQALALLAQAVTTPLLPPQTQQLISTLESLPKFVTDSDVVPSKKLPQLIESNVLVAIQVLLAIMTKPDMIAPYSSSAQYFSELIKMDMSLNSMEVINRLARTVDLPHDFINLYITNCLQQCQLHKDKYQQTRLVRLVCVFLQSLIQNRLWDVSDLFNEVQTFCIEFSRTREAAALFALLKQLEGEGSVKDGLSATIANAKAQ